MGFLRSFFGFDEEAELAEEKRKQEKLAAQDDLPGNFPALSVGDVVSVYRKDGKLLLSGKLTVFTTAHVSIERVPGQLSFQTCDVGEEVHIRGFTSASAIAFDLKGMVESSSRVLCRIRDVEVVVHDEMRGSFRLPMEAPISLYYYDDERLENPEKCTLVNVSVGGACIQSEFLHGEGEVLRMKMQLREYAPMTFLGEIVRVEEPLPGKFRYGFLFAQLDEKETNALTRVLFNLQAGNLKEWKRNQKSGVWE